MPTAAYLDQRRAAVRRFWRRLGGRPPLAGKAVLELGCGQGALCFDLAAAGAARVLGIDLNPAEIAAAQAHLTTRHPHLAPTVEFRCADIRTLAEPFDFIVSMDTFEHIVDLGPVLAHAAALLRPGGALYVGFGPLYNSPYGGHRRMRMPIPWGHLLLPEALLLWWVNRGRQRRVGSIRDIGLNQFALRDYLRLFAGCGLEPAYLKVNHGERSLSRLFALLARIPALREYFSHDIYCILRKPGQGN